MSAGRSTAGTVAVALVGIAAGAAATYAQRRALDGRPPGGAARWTRTNHRGEQVSLLEGAAYVGGTVAGTLATPGLTGRNRAATALATLGSGAFGAYDDLSGSSSSKGLKGHLSALRRGEVTTGAVKIVGIGASGLAAAALISDGPVEAVVGGAVVAGSANLANLLDLRPGRALKVGALGVLLLPASAGALGAAVACLPEDLGERGMLGDTGANALGAALGTALVARCGLRARLVALGALVALTLASEKVSFSKVIDATPSLRWVDQLGRRPAAR